jgi:hypothetical protein
MVSNENIPEETSFLTVISKGNWGKHISWELVARKNDPSRNTCNKIGFPVNNC